ncbi:hypothetical protein ACRRTK_005177 [Alexandromys fortis]
MTEAQSLVSCGSQIQKPEGTCDAHCHSHTVWAKSDKQEGTPVTGAGGNYTLLSGTKTTLSSEGNHLWMLVHDLVPCSHYMVQVNASNSQSSILSDPVSVEIHPAGYLSQNLLPSDEEELQYRFLSE